MLKLTIPAAELWDESKNEFITTKEQTLCLEHSLYSVSKWEAKHHKSFFSKTEKTYEELKDYIACMSLDENTDPAVYNALTLSHIQQINKYINEPMTATSFSEKGSGKGSREAVTAEIIYWQMIAAGVPFECQYWHINRLFTLLRVCAIKSKPPKKMSRGEIMRQNSALNSARRRRLGSRG